MMFSKSILACLLATSASAFVSQQSSSSMSLVSLNAAMDSMPGSIDFRGKEFKFDPLNLSETYEPFLPFFRESELRHGRTAMIATLGYIVQEFVRVPGDMYSFSSVPKSVDAHDTLVGQGPMGQLLLWIGLFDTIITFPAIQATMDGERTPGDFGWTLLAPKDEAKYKKNVDAELLHGRLAMMAFGGIATQSVITGGSFPYV